jgi:hypothetical protein
MYDVGCKAGDDIDDDPGDVIVDGVIGGVVVDGNRRLFV